MLPVGGRELRASGSDCGCGLPLFKHVPQAAAPSRSPKRCRAKLDLGRSQAHRPPREPLAPGTRRIGIRRSGVRRRLGFPWSPPRFPPPSAFRSCRSGWGSQPLLDCAGRAQRRPFYYPQLRAGFRPILKGFRPEAQGCEPASYPGKGRRMASTPTGVAFIRPTARTQPLWGWCPLAGLTQGSSFLATLGLATESRWDSRSFRPRLVANGKAATALLGGTTGPKAVSPLRSATAVHKRCRAKSLTTDRWQAQLRPTMPCALSVDKHHPGITKQPLGDAFLPGRTRSARKVPDGLGKGGMGARPTAPRPESSLPRPAARRRVRRQPASPLGRKPLVDKLPPGGLECRPNNMITISLPACRRSNY